VAIAALAAGSVATQTAPSLVAALTVVGVLAGLVTIEYRIRST
jgi:hypothetical protein